MTKIKDSRTRRLSLALALAVSVGVGCSGSAGKDGAAGKNGADGINGTNGTNGATGPVGPPGSGALTAESCSVCHGTGQEFETASMHAAAATNPLSHNNAVITAVTIPNGATTGGAPTVKFTVTDSAGAAVTGLTSFGITVARLEPDAGTGSSNWHSYMNRNFASATAPSVGGWMEQTIPYAKFSTAPVATCDENDGAGKYTCVLADDLSAVKTINTNYPVVTVAYDPQYKIRVGVQSNAPIPGTAPSVTKFLDAAAGGDWPDPVPANLTIQPTPPFNAFYDLDPATGAQVTTNPRALVDISACNGCHQQLAWHGGRRLNPSYCATCHNINSFDPKSPATARETIDLKRIIHKIHMGEDLPSVKLGTPSVINGEDFSEVAFPQDKGNCTACHKGTTGPAADSWKTAPGIVACTGCHDRTSFVSPPATGYTMHTGGVQPADSSTCHLCHVPGALLGADTVHGWGAGGLPGVAKAALSTSYKYAIVSATNTAPGQMPVVTIKVVDGTGAGVNLQTDPAWTSISDGASRLGVDIAWSTTDYQNAGSGSTPGQPITIDVLAKGVATTTVGQYTVTSTVAIPSTAKGSLAVAIEGHPADTSVTPHARIPVASVVGFYGITDSKPVPRRQTIDPSGCNSCHGQLTAHGNNRTLNSSDKNIICVICHNTEATDIKRRPTTGTTLDGLVEASVDFKKLIHGIHGADFSGAGPVIYGYGGSANDFRGVGFPGILQNCTACHIPGTYNTSAAVNGTTITTAALSDPDDNLRITRNAATCSACHASVVERSHMEQMGGAWGVKQADINAAQ